jgi:hypothetical protein
MVPKWAVLPVLAIVEWKELWEQQEVWAGGPRVVLLCGNVGLLPCRQEDVGFNNIALTLVNFAVTTVLGPPRCHS